MNWTNERNEVANNLAVWYPLLVASGAPTPRTEIIQATSDMSVLVDGRTPPGWTDLIVRLGDAGDRIGWPIFLRTGHGSGKHYWNKTCYVPKRADLADHVRELVEWSVMVDLIGLPTETWVVREFLQLDTRFTAFAGDMPIATEVRAFIGAGRIRCWHPYWPEAVFDDEVDGPVAVWQEHLAAMNKLAASENKEIVTILEPIATLFGEWSVDLCRLKTGGWAVTDMATAPDSYHWPGCPSMNSGSVKP